LMSFTPGFSQVVPNPEITEGNRLNGFRLFPQISVSRVSPGVNKTKARVSGKVDAATNFTAAEAASQIPASLLPGLFDIGPSCQQNA
jgi:hypothetical protein